MRQEKSVPAGRRAHPIERGAALLLFMILVMMAALAYLISNLTPEAIERRRAQQTQEALTLAREALIGYALQYREQQTAQGQLDRMYGHLPLPDLGTTRNNNIGCTQEGCDAANFSGNAPNTTVIGRLPWRTLGTEPLRDGHGECLWYAVSGSHQRQHLVSPMSWDTLAHLDIVVANGGAALASALANAHDRPVVVIFSPGPPLPGQDRQPPTSPPPTGDDVTRCSGNYNVANYLDPATATALGGVTNYLAGTNNAAGITGDSDLSNDPDAPKPLSVRGKIFASGSNFLPNACAGAECTLLANDFGLELTGDILFAAIRKHAYFRTDINSMLDRITDCLRDEIAASGGPSGYTKITGADGNSCYGSGVVPHGYYPNYRDMLFTVRGSLSVNGKTCPGALLFSNQRNNKWEPSGEPTGTIPACPKSNSANPFQCRMSATERGNPNNYLEGINQTSFTGAGALFSGQEKFERVSETQSISQDIVRCIPSTASFVTVQSAGLAAAGLPQLASYSPSTRTLTLGRTVSSTLDSSVSKYMYGCAWRPETNTMGSGLRSYFTFRINEVVNFSFAPHEGFTFAIVDGDNNGMDACGAAAQHLGYSGNNTESPIINPPKIGFEIDPRRSCFRVGFTNYCNFTPSYSDSTRNGRNDPATDSTAYRGGHAAITYWGGETSIDTTLAPAPTCTPPAFQSGATCYLPQEEDDNVHGQPASARSGFPPPPANPTAPVPPLSVPPDAPAGIYKLDPDRTQVPVNQDFHVRVELTRATASVDLPSVRVATTPSPTGIDLSNPGDTVDGVFLFEGDRVLVKDQPSQIENGVYVWNGANKQMTRADIADSMTKLAGLVVEVQQGAQNALTIWRQNATAPACPNALTCTIFTWTNIRVRRVEDLPSASAMPGSAVQIQLGSQATAWYRSDGATWQRQAVRATTQIPLDLNNPGTVIGGVDLSGTDAIALAIGNRVLVKNQNNAAENGIYVWNGAGIPMTRAGDADSASELAGSITQALAGNDAGRAFRQTTLASTGSLNADPVQWSAIDRSTSYLLEIWILPGSGNTNMIAAMQNTTRPMSVLYPTFTPHLRDRPIIPYPFRNARIGFTTGQRTTLTDQTISITNSFTTWLP